MIFGECPHCEAPICNGMPDKSPAIFKTDCDECGKDIWMYASRIEDCMAYPDRESLEENFILDEKTKKFKRREPVLDRLESK